MKKILVVGYGNTLRGDDGLGPLVAQKIADAPQSSSARVRVACLPQLDISLVAEIKDMDVVIFIDARHDDDHHPVTVKRLVPQDLSSCAGHTTHYLGAATLLGIAQDWFKKEQRGYLVMIKGYDFSISDKISAQGHRSAADAIEIISDIISGAGT